ncbi:MAG: hypothetical protein ACRD4X_05695 [Candidatus Acidiferrales bacterium]
MSRPKTLLDFPQFLVNAVHRGETSATGYTRYDLYGEFDRSIKAIDQHWFWLLIGERDCICASPQSRDHDSKAAVLSCDEKDEPKVVGQSLAYLSPYWQAYNVWMVLDPEWGWTRTQFHGLDAYAENFDAHDVSIVDGREVRVWTKLEPVDEKRGVSRSYPASNQTLPPDTDRKLIPGGWGHEHCDLCKAHIDPEQFGYRDPDERWMCEKCYERYVLQRDLAFVDEL